MVSSRPLYWDCMTNHDSLLYLHWTITFDIFFQQVQTQITTAYCRIIPALDPVVAPKRGWGATALFSGSASPPPPVGENLYICRGKLTKIWPTVPNHEKKYCPPVGEHSPSVGKFLAPALTGPQRLISFSGSSETNHGRL